MSWRVDFSPLRSSRDLRLLFVGGGISFAGSMVTYVALPYQAYVLTHSTLVVGALSGAELVPLVLTAFVGGALADALDRRLIIRLSEAGLCLVSGGLLANALLSHPQLWALFVSAVLLAGLDGIQRPSLAALVPQLVDEDQYAATSSLMVLRSQVGEIAAPALTGLLIAGGGLAATYAVDMASYLVSLGFLAALGVSPAPPEDAELSLAAVREGLRYAWTRKDLLGTYLVDMNAMFFGMPNALFPAFAVRLGGPSALGVLYAAPALGSFLVTLTSGWSTRVRRYGRMVALAAVVWGLGIVALGFSHALWEAAIALAVAGGADMVSGLGRLTMWNESIPTSLRGRLAGIEMLSYASGPTLGNLESGAVNTFAGLQATIVSGGVICAVGTSLLSLALPAFWKYDSAEGRLLRRSSEGGSEDGELPAVDVAAAAGAPVAADEAEPPSETMITPAPTHSPYLGRPSDEAGPGGLGRGVQ